MKKHTILLLAIIVIYLVNGIIAISRNSLTFDEGTHYNYGVRILNGNPDRTTPVVDNSKMPVSALNAIPRIVQQVLHPQLVKNDGGISDIINGRYITLLFSLLTILVVYLWASDLYGINAGLFAAFLFSWCPNNLAAAILTTTDAYSVFFLITTIYFLYKWCNSNKQKYFLLFAVMLGLSQLAKQSLFHLYPLSIIIVALYFWRQPRKIPVKIVTRNLLIVIITSFVIINAGFLFNKMFVPIGRYHFMSDLFIGLQNVFPSRFPVPLSKAFVEGMDMAKYYDQLGGGFVDSSFGNVTILGKSSTGGSFWYYYFVSIFYKTPVPFFILGAVAFYFSCKERFGQFVLKEWFLAAPIIYFLLLMSFLYKTQCGSRHIIFIYPLLIIYCSSIVPIIKTKTQRVLLLLISAWLILSVSLYKSNFFAYTNEFIFNKTMAYKKVGASNINFQQGTYRLNEYLKNNKDIRYVTEQPQAGTFVIVVDEYLDIWNTGKYKWIRHFEPVANVANGCYLVITVDQKQLRQ